MEAQRLPATVDAQAQSTYCRGDSTGGTGSETSSTLPKLQALLSVDSSVVADEPSRTESFDDARRKRDELIRQNSSGWLAALLAVEGSSSIVAIDKPLDEPSLGESFDDARRKRDELFRENSSSWLFEPISEADVEASAAAAALAAIQEHFNSRRIQNPDEVAAFSKALRDSNVQASRDALLRLLHEICSVSCSERTQYLRFAGDLIAVLSTSDPTRCIHALTIFREIGGELAPLAFFFAAQLRSKDHRVKIEAVRLLGQV
jgi:hypothetical protein